MKKYILGSLKYWSYRKISFFALISNTSQISRKVKINRFAKILHSCISSYTYIGSSTQIVNTSIGKYCSIARNCNIGLAKHTLDYISTSPIFTEKYNGTGFSWINKDIIKNKVDGITIGNDVWIGNGVTILGGVNIGHGAIIGAGAIVTKDVPCYGIVAGIPAKVIKYRFDKNTIQSLLELEWWNFPDEVLKRNISVFQTKRFEIQNFKKYK